MEIDPEQRYHRQIILSNIGLEGQQKLAQARVLVIGAGGLGCPVLQYLSAAGVGTIGIADGDSVDLSNLQRQVLYNKEDLGKNKAEKARDHLYKLNDQVTYLIYPFHVTSDNILSIVQEFAIIADCTDNFSARYLINDACVISGKPFVYASLYKYEAQVSVFNYKEGPTYRCLYPDQPGPGVIENCAEAGILGSLAGIAGSIQANEILKMVLGFTEILSGKVLSIDSRNLSFHSFKLTRNEKLSKVTQLGNYEVNSLCDLSSTEVTVSELINLVKENRLQLIDVREKNEYFSGHIPNSVSIPLNDLPGRLNKLNKEQKIILYCHSGTRSKKALTLLTEKGFTNIAHLMGGFTEWKKSN